MFRFALTAAALFLGISLAACERSPSALDPQQLAMARLAGSYRAGESLGAITLTTSEAGETIDWLARGARLQLELRGDGSTSGRLFIPDADEDGGDMDESLAGEWSLRGDTVRLSHEADTFLRDMPFVVRGAQLEGDRSFGGGTRVRLVLVRR